jgi:adenine phosphoribosyltransferase
MSNLELDEEIKYLVSNLAVIPDFPKPGIIFRDTLSLFSNPQTFQRVIDLFASHIKSLNVEAIVGLEARGFILGGAIAYKLNLPFVPIRKVRFNYLIL